VAAAVRMMLKDRAAIAVEVEELDCDAVRVKSIFEAASAWSERLGSEAQAAESFDSWSSVSSWRKMGSRFPSSCPSARREKLATVRPLSD